jgi:hypothetical protein
MTRTGKRAAVVLVVLGLTAGCHATPARHQRTNEVRDARLNAAEHDAARILAAFTPPAGAHRLTGEPAGADALNHAVGLDGPQFATKIAWWSTAGPPSTVIRALAKPAGATSTYASDDGSLSMVESTWAPTDILVNRELVVVAGPVGDATVLRVLASSLWVPPRDPATFIPTTATSLIASWRPGVSGKSYGPDTIVDRHRVAAVAALLNAEPVNPAGPSLCPGPFNDLELSFRNAAGVEVASVTVDDGPCGGTFVRVGAAQAALTGGAAPLLAALDLNWNQG